MKKLKKIWQENSVLFVLLFILIACLVAICVVVVTYFVGDSSSKYGDRLEGIKDYPFDEDTQNEIISQIKEEKIVEDVTMRISGKIIYITITFVPETTLVEGQSVALSSLDYFSEETLSFYDLEYMIEADSTEETEGMHYETDPLTQISYKESVSLDHLATDLIDAYYHVEEVDLSKSQNIEGILLHRPFGKIRLIATDMLTDGASQSEYPASVKIDYKQIEVPASFDALNEKPLDATLKIGDITSSTISEDATVNGNTYSGAFLLGYHYIFATDASTAYEIDVTAYDQNGNEICSRSLSRIPVQKNKLTTVIGNFYTNEGTLKVVVEAPFEEPENEVPASTTTLP